jgi:hypothetical protein
MYSLFFPVIDTLHAFILFISYSMRIIVQLNTHFSMEGVIRIMN